MKLPLIWLSDYVESDLNPEKIADSFTAIGLMLDKPIENNTLDLEHRMDRSDWLSILGCARDFAALEKLKLKYPPSSAKKGAPANPSTLVPIRVTARSAVRRFTTRVFRDVTVKPSPRWLKERLELYGIPIVNNIVDITNFVMVEYGQPMHAQDLARFTKREIVLRFSKKGEKIQTLLGENVALENGMLVLSQNNIPIVIGGIVGSSSTGVTASTKEIILDAGNYNQSLVRKTSRTLKIANETVMRYDKFLDPRLTEVAIERASSLILELAGGKCYENIDYYPHPVEPQIMTLRLKRLHKLSGEKIPLREASSILKRLEYAIIDQNQHELTVEVPYFRTDIAVEDDLVSDILRIRNYANIPTSHMVTAPPREITPPRLKLENKIRLTLMSFGAHEHITDPLVEYQNKPGQIRLINALTSEKSALRTSVLETLSAVRKSYKKYKITQYLLFEIGRAYSKKKWKGDNEYIESNDLGIICENPALSPQQKASTLNSLTRSILTDLGIHNPEFISQGNSVIIRHLSRQIGKLEESSAILHLDLIEKLVAPSHIVNSKYQQLQYFDLSLTLKVGQTFGPIYSYLSEHKQLQSIEVLETYENNTDGDKSLSILVRIFIEPKQNLDKIRTQLINKISSDFQVVSRS